MEDRLEVTLAVLSQSVEVATASNARPLDPPLRYASTSDKQFLAYFTILFLRWSDERQHSVIG